jgi:hypothetical protein
LDQLVKIDFCCSKMQNYCCYSKNKKKNWFLPYWVARFISRPTAEAGLARPALSLVPAPTDIRPRPPRGGRSPTTVYGWHSSGPRDARSPYPDPARSASLRSLPPTSPSSAAATAQRPPAIDAATVLTFTTSLAPNPRKRGHGLRLATPHPLQPSFGKVRGRNGWLPFGRRSPELRSARTSSFAAFLFSLSRVPASHRIRGAPAPPLPP